MQPQNPNPDHDNNPNPGVPGQPFQRRPVQPIAPRPFAQAQPPASPPPQTTQYGQPAPQMRPQPQVVDQFVKPAPSAPAQQFANQDFRPAPRPVSPPTAPVQQFAPGPDPRQTVQIPPQPKQPTDPLDLDLDREVFSKPLLSQTEKSKRKLPVGTIALITIGLAGLGIGLMDKSQNSMLFNVMLGLNAAIAFALFIRKEFIHKAAFGLAMITITASAALVLGYHGLISNTANAESLFIAEAKKLQNMSPTKQLTHEQQQHLDAMQFQLEAQKNAVGQNSTLVYAKYGGTIVAYGLAALYLSRPKVKAAYAPAQK